MDQFQPIFHGLLPHGEDHHDPFELSANWLYDTTDFVDYPSDYPSRAFPDPQHSTGPILTHGHQHNQWELAASCMAPPSDSASVTPPFTDLDHTSSQCYSPFDISNFDFGLDQHCLESASAPSADTYPSLSTSADTFPIDIELQAEAEDRPNYTAISISGSSVAPAHPSTPLFPTLSPKATSKPVYDLHDYLFPWPISPKLQNAVTKLASSKEFRNNTVIPTHLRRPFLKRIRHALEVRTQTSGKGSRNGAFAYKCLWNNCGRITTRQDHALDHVAQHFGSKPHKCPYCSLRFLRLADCKRHARSIEHHGVSNKSDSVSLEGLEVWEQCHTMGEFSALLTWELFARLVRGVARFLRGRLR